MEQVLVKIEDDLRHILIVAKQLAQDSFDLADDGLLEKLNQYLEDLEDWQLAYKQSITFEENNVKSVSSVPNRNNLKQLLTELETNHAIIMSKSSVLMSDVNSEIGKVNRSSTVIKSYLNNSMGFTRRAPKKG